MHKAIVIVCAVMSTFLACLIVNPNPAVAQESDSTEVYIQFHDNTETQIEISPTLYEGDGGNVLIYFDYEAGMMTTTCVTPSLSTSRPDVCDPDNDWKTMLMCFDDAWLDCGHEIPHFRMNKPLSREEANWLKDFEEELEAWRMTAMSISPEAVNPDPSSPFPFAESGTNGLYRVYAEQQKTYIDTHANAEEAKIDAHANAEEAKIDAFADTESAKFDAHADAESAKFESEATRMEAEIEANHKRTEALLESESQYFKDRQKRYGETGMPQD